MHETSYPPFFVFLQRYLPANAERYHYQSTHYILRWLAPAPVLLVLISARIVFPEDQFLHTRLFSLYFLA